MKSVLSLTHHQAQLWSIKQKWHVTPEEPLHLCTQTRWHIVLNNKKNVYYCVQLTLKLFLRILVYL